MKSLHGMIPALVAMALWPTFSAWAGGKSVNVVRTPDGGIQPQALMDGKGNLHLLYFKGDPAAGDLYYVRRDKGKGEFTAPRRVNSQPNSAIAVGSIRGGQLALGKGGRVHVAWNGSGKALPKGTGKYTAPMLYARLNDAGDAFDEQRNLMQHTDALDGGGSVAADAAGNVFVAWHAFKLGSTTSERDRQVWLAP